MRNTVIARVLVAVAIAGALTTVGWAQRLTVDWKMPDELVLRCKGWIGSSSPTSWREERIRPARCLSYHPSFKAQRAALEHMFFFECIASCRPPFGCLRAYSGTYMTDC